MGNRGRRALIGTMMCAVLAVTGCSLPWGGKPKDKRFAEFSEYVPEKLEVKTDLEAVTTRRMPGLHASAAHWVGQREEKPREVLPDQDPRYWFTPLSAWNPIALALFRRLRPVSRVCCRRSTPICSNTFLKTVLLMPFLRIRLTVFSMSNTHRPSQKVDGSSSRSSWCRRTAASSL